MGFFGFGNAPASLAQGVQTGATMYAPAVTPGSKDINQILEQVRAGLPNESVRLDEARKNCDFYEGDMARYITFADAETVYDQQFRPKRYSMLCRSAIEKRAQHLYSQGPQRVLTKAPSAVDKWLQNVYAANHIDALFHKADELSDLNGVAAFQVAALGGPGDAVGAALVEDPEQEIEDTPGYDLGPDSPIKIHLRGSEELAVWCEPGDPLRPWCVCTIDRMDSRTRFQVWTKDAYYTLYAELDPGRGVNSARTAYLRQGESGANPYGVLPFSFVFATIPTRQFWVTGAGDSLRRANHYVINALSDLANSLRYYIRPFGWAKGVRPDWRPVIRPGSFTHLPAAEGGTEQRNPPEVGYLQADVDYKAVLEDLDAFVNRTLEEHDIPPAVFHLDVSANTSGVAIILHHQPLLDRTKGRQRPFGRYEADLARTILAVGGGYYQQAALWDAAHNGRLILTWPEVTIQFPGMERDQNDEYEVENGYASKIEILMRRRGFTRDQAIKHLEQIKKDNEELERLGLAATPGEAPVIDEATGEPVPAETEAHEGNEPDDSETADEAEE